jgi:hypothetical protein
MTIDMQEVQRIVDTRMANTRLTESIIKPLLEKLVPDFFEMTFHASNYEFYLSCDNTESKYYGIDYIGNYEKESENFSIHMKSEKSFDLFHTVFPTAPKLDLVYIKGAINDIKMMYSFVLGLNIDMKVDDIEDLKCYYYWNGHNYLFVAKQPNEHIYVMRISHYFCLKTESIQQYYYYDFRHPLLRFSVESFNSLENLKSYYFQEIAKMLNKPIEEIMLSDHKVLPIINY